MRCYVAAAFSEPADPVRVERRLATAGANGLPVPSGGTPDLTWWSADRRVVIAAWSNEPEQSGRPLLAQPPGGGVFGWAGYLSGEVGAAGAALAGSPDQLADVGGIWALVAAAPGLLRGATCASGGEQLFTSTSRDAVWLGTRALVTHLAAADSASPAFDLVGLAGLVNVGYAPTDRTAYAGVRAVPPATVVEAHRDGWRVAPIPEIPPGTYDIDDGADALAEALTTAVSSWSGCPTQVTIALSGGKDSRLVLSALLAAGVPVRAVTRGLPEHPDVVVAERLCAVAGIAHTRTQPIGARVRADGVLLVDPLSFIQRAVVLADGMVSGYSAVGRIGGAFSLYRGIGGAGGEIARGGYAKYCPTPEYAERAAVWLTRTLTMRQHLLRPGVRADYLADVQPWLDRVADDPPATLEDFYVRQRAGRWSGATRGAQSVGSLVQQPLLDHRVVRVARGVTVAGRVDERLIAALQARLGPQLADVPFADKRHVFEAKAPVHPADKDAWERRAPVVAGDQRAVFNWRAKYGAEIAGLFGQLVDEGPAVGELVDQARARSALSTGPSRTRAEAATAWQLATTAALMSGRFAAIGAARFGRSGLHVVVVPPADPAPPDRAVPPRSAAPRYAPVRRPLRPLARSAAVRRAMRTPAGSRLLACALVRRVMLQQDS